MKACQISPNVLCSGMLVKYRWETIPPTKEKSTSGKLFQNILILRKVEHSSNSVRFGECTGYLKCSISSQLRSYTSINSLSLSPTLSQLAQMGTHTHTIIFFQIESIVWWVVTQFIHNICFERGICSKIKQRHSYTNMLKPTDIIWVLKRD